MLSESMAEWHKSKFLRQIGPSIKQFDLCEITGNEERKKNKWAATKEEKNLFLAGNICGPGSLAPSRPWPHGHERLNRSPRTPLNCILALKVLDVWCMGQRDLSAGLREIGSCNSRRSMDCWRRYGWAQFGTAAHLLAVLLLPSSVLYCCPHHSMLRLIGTNAVFWDAWWTLRWGNFS